MPMSRKSVMATREANSPTADSRKHTIEGREAAQKQCHFTYANAEPCPSFTQQLQYLQKYETASATIPVCHGVAPSKEIVEIPCDGNDHKRVGLCDDSNTASCLVAPPQTQVGGPQPGLEDSTSPADYGWTNKVAGSLSSQQAACEAVVVNPSRSWTAITQGTSIRPSTVSAQISDDMTTNTVSSSTITSIFAAVTHRGFFSNLTTSKTTIPELQNSVTVPFQKTENFHLKKCEDRFKTYHLPVPPALAHEWDGIGHGVTGVRVKLERELRPIVSASGFGTFFQIEYVMVGYKVGEDFTASPHILITCGMRRCKRDLEEFLSTSQPDCMSMFNQPWIVHYEKTPSSWKANTSGVSDTQVPFPESLSTQTSAQNYDLRGVSAILKGDVGAGCGTRINVTSESNRDARSATPVDHWAHIGGVLTVLDQAYAFTTAHVLLMGLQSPSERESRGSSHSWESLDEPVSSDEEAEPNVMLPQPHVVVADDCLKVPTFSTIALADAGAYGFADKGVSMSDPRHDVAIVAGSDWAMFKLSKNAVYENSYWATRHGLSEEKVTVDTMAEESHLVAGPVKILQGPHIVLEGYLTQTTASFLTGDGVFAVRQIVLDAALEAGTSGCWVVRNNQLCGHIIAGEDYANVAYMIPITWTLNGIKTVMGGEATLQPDGAKQATGILSDQKRDQEQSQLTLVISALQSSKTLYQAFDSLQYNGRTVRELKEELVALNEVLQLLQETVHCTDTGLSALELPLSSCAKACAGFAAVVARYTTERSRSSFHDWSRLSYLGKDVAGFRLLVAGYKSTIAIALADANILTAVVTAELRDEYKEMIKSTTADLEELLNELDDNTKGERSQLPKAASRIEDIDDEKVVEERASIQQGLRICENALAHIDQLEANSFGDTSTPSGKHYEAMKLGSITPPQFTASRTLENCKRITDVTSSQLKVQLDDLKERIARMSQVEGMLNENGPDSQSMKEELGGIIQGLAICTKAMEEFAQDQANIFKDVRVADDGHQFVVTTLGDLISAKRITIGVRSTQWIGQISDASLRQLCKEHKDALGSDRDIGSKHLKDLGPDTSLVAN